MSIFIVFISYISFISFIVKNRLFIKKTSITPYFSNEKNNYIIKKIFTI
jgi:hypothetical protein